MFLCFQLLQRGKSREQRLQDALRNIQGNAALVEELLSWLTEAQVLLATKEKDPIPEDLNVVETLAKEHSVSLVPYEPQHEISNNVVCDTSNDSDQPAHMRRLIRAFASRLDII